MLLFKRGIRKVIPGIVIPGINTKYVPQFVSKDDNFRKMVAKLLPPISGSFPEGGRHKIPAKNERAGN